MTRSLQAARAGRLVALLSSERLTPYRRGGVSDVVALARYAENVAACEAFYPALQVLEVALRNRIVDVFAVELPKRYPGLLTRTSAPLLGAPEVVSWIDPLWLARTWPRGLPPLLSSRAQQEVFKAKKRLFGSDPRTGQLRTPLPGKPPITEGQLVAEMESGFWTGLFDNAYIFRGANDPRLWGRTPVLVDPLTLLFPYRRPAFKQPKEVGPRLNDLRHFRNRVFHHEPIFATSKRRPPLDVYEDILEVLGWIEPEAVRTLEGLCRVRRVLSTPGQRGVKAALHRLMRRS